MEKLQLSIIVPIYNTAEYLPQCIESILNQEYKDFELILVDDGSSDNSLSICQNYQNTDGRIKIIHKENGGLISAKKAGLNVAKGQYVGFVDSDDWIDANMYSCLMNAAIENNADVIIGDNVIEYPERTVKVKQGICYGLYNKNDLIKTIYPNLIYKENDYSLGVSPSLCTKIFKTNLLKKHQDSVDERIKAGEDAACTYPCLLEAESIEYVKDCCSYHYRIHGTSMTHRKEKMNVDEKIALLNHLYSKLFAYDYPGLKKQLCLYSANILDGYIVNSFENHICRREMLQDIKKIHHCQIWKIINEKNSRNNFLKSVDETMEYLRNPNIIKDTKLRFRICLKNKKQVLKIWLSLIKRGLIRGIKGERRDTK